LLDVGIGVVKVSQHTPVVVLGIAMPGNGRHVGAGPVKNSLRIARDICTSC
jgi:hypothetical protein